MQAQDRLVSRPTRPFAFGVAIAVALVASLLTVVLLTGVLHSGRTSANASHVAVLSSTPDNQAPDAKERNDIYSQALAQSFKNLSPDAQERNQQLSGR